MKIKIIRHIANVVEERSNTEPKMPEEVDDDERSSSSESEVDSEITLESITKSGSIYLPIRSTYATWGPVEAFREFVQNWRDAIIASFRLSETDFRVIREERRQGGLIEIVHKVPMLGSDPPEYLGYILFNERQGTVEIVNRKAQLKPSHLELGGTNKNYSHDQAGIHGKGLKIAVIVMQQKEQNHSVQCIHGSFNWNFKFSNVGRLVASLRRMSARQMESEDARYGKQEQQGLIPFAPSVSDDVLFIIGGQGQGRDEEGRWSSRSSVRLVEFNNWCECALFLQDVSQQSLVSGTKGDLLTDKKLCGNIYFKGLLLKKSFPFRSASITGLKMKFGYNVQDGQIDWQRGSFQDGSEERKAITEVWEGVIPTRPDYMTVLNDLLISNDLKYLESAKALAPLNVSRSTAKLLRDHLFADDTKWYFSAEERRKYKDLETTILNLGRTGVELPDEYWNSLSHRSLVSRAIDEQKKRFLSAKIVKIPNDDFAQDTFRILEASLYLEFRTRHAILHFVQAGQLPMHVCYVEKRSAFKIHERWLNKEASKEELGLFNDLSNEDIVFHVVRQLFSDLLDELPDSYFEHMSHQPISWQRNRTRREAEQRLLQYLQVRQNFVFGTNGLSPTVEWKIKSWCAIDDAVSIQIHHSDSCSHLRCYPFSRDFTETMECIRQKQSAQNKIQCLQFMVRDMEGVKFITDLAPSTNYFAVMFNASKSDSLAVISDTYLTPYSIGEPATEPGTYTLGTRLPTLDMLIPRTWYEAAGRNPREAVIGILQNQPAAVEEESSDSEPFRRTRQCKRGRYRRKP